MKKIFTMSILLIILSLMLTSCSSIGKSEIVVEKTDLGRSDKMTINVTIDYSQPLTFNNRKTQDFRITFYTGNSLKIYEVNSNQQVTTDVFRNVSVNATKLYEVRSNWVNEKKVEKIEVLIVSDDGKINERIASPFITISP